LLILTVLWEAFETIVLHAGSPQFRLTRLFIAPPGGLGVPVECANPRKSVIPCSAIRTSIIASAAGILGGCAGFRFGLVHYACMTGFRECFSTVIRQRTLPERNNVIHAWLGDVQPASAIGRFITVLEAGIGFGFCAGDGYLPVLYQAFSRREVTISLLDARAGSPPTAHEMLRGKVACTHGSPD